MLEGMPASYAFLRYLLAALAGGCAFMAGRSLAGFQRGFVKRSTFTAWIIRAAACAIAVAFGRKIDVGAIAVWCLCAAAFASGWRDGRRTRNQEDLTNVIFPGDR